MPGNKERLVTKKIRTPIKDKPLAPNERRGSLPGSKVILLPTTIQYVNHTRKKRP